MNSKFSILDIVNQYLIILDIVYKKLYINPYILYFIFYNYSLLFK